MPQEGSSTTICISCFWKNDTYITKTLVWKLHISKLINRNQYFIAIKSCSEVYYWGLLLLCLDIHFLQISHFQSKQWFGKKPNQPTNQAKTPAKIKQWDYNYKNKPRLWERFQHLCFSYFSYQLIFYLFKACFHLLIYI